MGVGVGVVSVEMVEDRVMEVSKVNKGPLIRSMGGGLSIL